MNLIEFFSKISPKLAKFNRQNPSLQECGATRPKNQETCKEELLKSHQLHLILRHYANTSCNTKPI